MVLAMSDQCSVRVRRCRGAIAQPKRGENERAGRDRARESLGRAGPQLLIHEDAHLVGHQLQHHGGLASEFHRRSNVVGCHAIIRSSFPLAHADGVSQWSQCI